MRRRLANSSCGSRRACRACSRDCSVRRRHVFAQVLWDVSLPDSPLGHDSISGTPEAMRRLADLATQAAIQAEEEACWQAHQDDATAAQAAGRVA